MKDWKKEGQEKEEIEEGGEGNEGGDGGWREKVEEEVEDEEVVRTEKRIEESGGWRMEDERLEERGAGGGRD
jgi:hypothetical protein